MGKLEEAKDILSAIGMPRQQTNDRSAYVLLALAGVDEDDNWQSSKIIPLRIVDMMNFMAESYGKIYKPNSRESIRKNTVHQFVEAAIAEENVGTSNVATNSPNYSYQLTKEMLRLIQSYGTDYWSNQLSNFVRQKGRLVDVYSQKRDLRRIPVVINGQPLTFSEGEHNLLQKLILEEFAPRFAPGSEVLYVGDTDNKTLVVNRELLNELCIDITDNDKLPDVVLYEKGKGWIYFIEAVTSVGPMSVKRMLEIEGMTEECSMGKIYVTAFIDTVTFKKFIDELAWESEVWIADNPDHMIHLNGDRFIGPR
jgi:hypothetical protein